MKRPSRLVGRVGEFAEIYTPSFKRATDSIPDKKNSTNFYLRVSVTRRHSDFFSNFLLLRCLFTENSCLRCFTLVTFTLYPRSRADERKLNWTWCGIHLVYLCFFCLLEYFSENFIFVEKELSSSKPASYPFDSSEIILFFVTILKMKSFEGRF